MEINTAIIAKKYLLLFLSFEKAKREPELPFLVFNPDFAFRNSNAYSGFSLSL
jgi:hypothetical protein